MCRVILFILCNFISYSVYALDMFEIRIAIKNHYFEPSQVFAPAGKKIKLIISNEDSTIEEFESHDLKREKIIPAHSSVNIVLAPLNPGEYNFFGEFHEDTAQGKLLVVTEAEYSEKIININNEKQ